MKKNLLIAIGRQFGSGGHEIARRLSKELNIPIYDKELLKMQAKESGIAETVLEAYDEKPTSSLLYSIVMDVYPAMNYAGASLNQQVYQAQFDTIRNLKDQGSSIIVGRAADYILRDEPGLVSVFIHAPLEVRAQRVAEFEGVSFQAARDMVTKADKKRSSYYNFQTDRQWGAASSYMLSIDSSAVGYDGAVQIIKTFAEMKKSVPVMD
ncbi:MAG: cytidylate kinase-like family protein [Lachnospiraceae bacterium]|nr:cytidylate kinase-like family protein [Lachnospiraceae bacterium]